MKGDPSVRGWPSSEVFLPTEVVRAGMQWLSLAEFGDVSQYDWFPPTLEEDLVPGDRKLFIHPVLDRRRYLASIFHNRGPLKPGEMKNILARFPRQELFEAHMARRPQSCREENTSKAPPLEGANRLVSWYLLRCSPGLQSGEAGF
jgi:hypothetical protein